MCPGARDHSSAGEIFVTSLVPERFNNSITIVSKCKCGCGKDVTYKGNYQRKCLPAGMKNHLRPSGKVQAAKSKNCRKEVPAAAVVANLEYPALMKQQMKDATSKSFISFNKKYLQFRKQNEGKEIAVSIAVVSEGLHPSTGILTGKSIVREMQNAPLVNLVRIVTHKRVSYYENPAIEEGKALGAPGELQFDAKGNRQLAMFVEKAMQVQVLHRENFFQKKIRLLQFTAGNRVSR